MARPDITAHIKANAQGFHTSMARIRRDAKQTATSSGAAFEMLSSRLRGGVAGILGGLTVGAGLSVFIRQAKQAVAEVEEIGKSAKTAGVRFEAFQELSYTAKKNLVSVEALTDGLKEMQLRVDEVVTTGKGSAAESLGRLGYSAKELAVALKEPDKLFEDIIGRMKQLDQAAQIRVADEIFGGTAGEQFVRLLDETRGSIADNRKEAQELGLVISEDLAARIDELRPVWDKVALRISTHVKKAVLEIVELMGTALDRYNAIADRTQGTLSLDQSAIDMRRVDIENKILSLQEEQRQNTSAVAQAENRMLDGKIAELRAQLAELTTESGQIAQQLSTFENRKSPPTTPIKPSTLGQGAAKISDADRQRKKILELIDALEFESRTLKMNETQQRVANELRKAGALITPQQTETITRLVEANEAEKRSRELANEAMERQQQIYEQFGSTVESTIEGLITKSVTLEQALINIGIAAVKSLLDINKLGGSGGSGGGIGGLIGSAFSAIFGGGFGGSKQVANILQTGAVGLFAKGGVSNRPAIFAEAGPEAAVPLPDGRRIPVDLRGAGGGGEAPISITYSPTNIFSGTSEEMDSFRAQVAEDRATFSRRVVETVREASKRRGL